jgi:two-component system response regulator HydG
MENSIEYATVLVKGRQLEASDLPAALHETVPTAGSDRRPYLMDQERKIIQEVLEECAWNKKKAARRLGISRSTLYGKIKRYQIVKPTTH